MITLIPPFLLLLLLLLHLLIVDILSQALPELCLFESAPPPRLLVRRPCASSLGPSSPLPRPSWSGLRPPNLPRRSSASNLFDDRPAPLPPQFFRSTTNPTSRSPPPRAITASPSFSRRARNALPANSVMNSSPNGNSLAAAGPRVIHRHSLVCLSLPLISQMEENLLYR